MLPSTEERGLREVVVDQESAQIDRVVIASNIGWETKIRTRVRVRLHPKASTISGSGAASVSDRLPNKSPAQSYYARSSTDVSERILRGLRLCFIPAVADANLEVTGEWGCRLSCLQRDDAPFHMRQCS
jgi:hypothetical protein